jgi:hypothetical protein
MNSIDKTEKERELSGMVDAKEFLQIMTTKMHDNQNPIKLASLPAI